MKDKADNESVMLYFVKKESQREPKLVMISAAVRAYLLVPAPL